MPPPQSAHQKQKARMAYDSNKGAQLELAHLRDIEPSGATGLPRESSSSDTGAESHVDVAEVRPGALPLLPVPLALGTPRSGLRLATSALIFTFLSYSLVISTNFTFCSLLFPVLSM